MKKTIFINIIVAILLPFVGLLFLLLVHLLPTQKMAVNVGNSIESIEAEFEDELVIDGYRATMSGNFTDCLMLQFSVYDGGHSVVEQAMNMYRTESCPDDGEWWPGLSLRDYLNGTSQPREVEYSRYWHGYLVVLKPLLLFFSFNSIRLLNSILQFGMLALVLIGLSKKGYSRVAVSMTVATSFMFISSSFASLSLSICLYLMLSGLLVMVYFNDKLDRINGYYTYFLIMGAMTSYFDFLTYPIVTFGFPVCVYLCMHQEKVKKRFVNFVVFGGLWSFGYIYMWATKWIFSDVLANNSTIKDALFTVGVRTGSDTVSFVQVLAKNLDPYINRPYLLVLVAVMILSVVWIVKDKIQGRKLEIVATIPLIVMVIAPFLWWMFTQNHSGQHWVFTCRNFSLSVFSFLCLAGYLLRNRGDKSYDV